MADTRHGNPALIQQQAGQIGRDHGNQFRDTQRMLDRLKAAGFNWLALGIEAGSGRVRADADKDFDQDEIYRTVERIRRISATELEDIITIHDPKYYTRDWQARFVYTLRDDVWLEGYVCGEPHRDLSSVVGVRRP